MHLVFRCELERISIIMLLRKVTMCSFWCALLLFMLLCCENALAWMPAALTTIQYPECYQHPLRAKCCFNCATRYFVDQDREFWRELLPGTSMGKLNYKFEQYGYQTRHRVYYDCATKLSPLSSLEPCDDGCVTIRPYNQNQTGYNHSEIYRGCLTWLFFDRRKARLEANAKSVYGKHRNLTITGNRSTEMAKRFEYTYCDSHACNDEKTKLFYNDIDGAAISKSTDGLSFLLMMLPVTTFHCVNLLIVA